MPESASRSRLGEQPSHLELLQQINGRFDLLDRRFDAVEERLARGEKRFDRLESKIDAADITRGEMLADLSVLQTSADAAKTPPWYLGWKPVAVGLSLALFAGAGLTALAIAGLDIVPKLTAIKNAVQP
jgi:hypothetical protein